MLLSGDPLVETHLHLFLSMHVSAYRGIFGDQVETGYIALRGGSAGNTDRLSALAGCPVQVGQSGDWVAAPRALVDRHLPLADPWLRDLLRPQLDAFLQQLDQGNGAALSVRDLLENALKTGRPLDLDGAAAMLRIKPRTLRSRLAAEGTTFSDLLDAARKECSLAQMAGPGVKLAAIAAQLGFSDSTAFTRAFRRWTGSTPSDWQARYAAQWSSRALPGALSVASVTSRAAV
jgi:AraC-like DNA-binding protein